MNYKNILRITGILLLAFSIIGVGVYFGYQRTNKQNESSNTLKYKTVSLLTIVNNKQIAIGFSIPSTWSSAISNERILITEKILDDNKGSGGVVNASLANKEHLSLASNGVWIENGDVNRNQANVYLVAIPFDNLRKRLEKDAVSYGTNLQSMTKNGQRGFYLQTPLDETMKFSASKYFIMEIDSKKSIFIASAGGGSKEFNETLDSIVQNITIPIGNKTSTTNNSTQELSNFNGNWVGSRGIPTNDVATASSSQLYLDLQQVGSTLMGDYCYYFNNGLTRHDCGDGTAAFTTIGRVVDANHAILSFTRYRDNTKVEAELEFLSDNYLTLDFKLKKQDQSSDMPFPSTLYLEPQIIETKQDCNGAKIAEKSGVNLTTTANSINKLTLRINKQDKKHCLTISDSAKVLNKFSNIGRLSDIEPANLISVIDVNFDGYNDISIGSDLNINGVTHGYYWIYDIKTSKYIYGSQLRNFESLTLDDKTKTLMNFQKNGCAGACYVESTYRFINSDLELIKEVEQLNNGGSNDTTFDRTTYELINGKLELSKTEHFRIGDDQVMRQY